MDVTIKHLAREFEMSVSHICKLIERGVLPAGRKDGRVRYLPEVEARLILASWRQLHPKRLRLEDLI